MKALTSYTITCHRPFNYGAVLQTYALNCTLLSMGVDAKVIDYYPDYYTSSKKSLPIQLARKLLRLPDWILGKVRFGRFLKKNIPLSPLKYKNLDQLFENVPMADIYFAGSDQIWNCHELENGKDDAFFLSFAPKGRKKISYAASLAMPDIPKNQKERYRRLISTFDAVSIREKDGVELVKNLGVDDVVNVLDPVYLLKKEDWDKLASHSEFTPKEKYILVYGFKRQKNIYEYARQLATSLNVKVYAINTNVEDYFLDIDKYFWNSSPNTFINLVKNAEGVITNSFHGLSFSIIYNKPFHFFTRNGKANSRMLNLLGDLKLSDRIVSSSSILLNTIDYSAVNQIISEKREFSLSFLTQSIFGNEIK